MTNFNIKEHRIWFILSKQTSSNKLMVFRCTVFGDRSSYINFFRQLELEGFIEYMRFVSFQLRLSRLYFASSFLPFPFLEWECFFRNFLRKCCWNIMILAYTRVIAKTKWNSRSTEKTKGGNFIIFTWVLMGSNKTMLVSLTNGDSVVSCKEILVFRSFPG